MKEIKPILTIGVSSINDEAMQSIYENLSQTIKDYHIIIYPLLNREDIKFNILSIKDIEEKDINQLRQIVLNQGNL